MVHGDSRRTALSVKRPGNSWYDAIWYFVWATAIPTWGSEAWLKPEHVNSEHFPLRR